MEGNQRSDAPEWIETMVNEFAFGEFVGMADDKSRFGIECDSLGSVSTGLALKNGYTIEEVRENGMGDKEHNLSITFARLGTQ